MEVNHVRGHQDKKKRKEQLTMAGKLNIMAKMLPIRNHFTSKTSQWQCTSRRKTSPTISERIYVLIAAPKKQPAFSKKNTNGNNKL